MIEVRNHELETAINALHQLGREHRFLLPVRRRIVHLKKAASACLNEVLEVRKQLSETYDVEAGTKIADAPEEFRDEYVELENAFAEVDCEPLTDEDMQHVRDEAYFGDEYDTLAELGFIVPVEETQHDAADETA